MLCYAMLCYVKKGGIVGICSLIFNLSDQSYDYKDYFLKSRPYAILKAMELQRNIKHFKYW